jgi:hypothetical protein
MGRERGQRLEALVVGPAEQLVVSTCQILHDHCPFCLKPMLKPTIGFK